MKDIGDSIAFRLRGTKSNRDAIGTSITVEAGKLSQTKYLQAGSGFLAQHSKEVSFGTRKAGGNDPVSQFAGQVGSLRDSKACLQTIGSKSRKAPPTLSSSPSPRRPLPTSQTGPPPKLEPLPSQVDTWLVEPLLARVFSLPDPRAACENSARCAAASGSRTSGRQRHRSAATS